MGRFASRASLGRLAFGGALLVCGAASARLPFVPPPAASAPADLPWPAPWFALAAQLPADKALGLFTDSPLRGEARVELRVSAPLPRVGLALVVDVPELRVGEAPVGHLRLRAFAPLGGDGLVARMSLDGPAGRIEAELALPERFAPGPALIEAIVAPWLDWDLPVPPSDPTAEAVEAVAPETVPLPEPTDALDDLRAVAADWPEAPLVRLHFADLDLDRLTDVFPDLALSGRASGAFALDETGLRARVDGEVVWRGGGLGVLRTEVVIDRRDARFTADLGAAPTAIHLEGHVPVDFDPAHLTAAWRDADPLAVALTARRLTPDGMAAFHRLHPAADFEAEVTLSATGALDDLRVVGRVDGTLRDGETARPLTAQIDMSPTRQTAAFALGGEKPLLQLDLETIADLVALRRTEARPEAVPLTGALVADVPLGTLMPYMPAAVDDPRGALAGRIDATGTLGAPALNGALGVTDGQATVVAANARLVDIDLAVRVDGSAARIETLGARSGRGRLSGGGAARWIVTPEGHAGPLWGAWRFEGDFAMTLDDMPLVRPGLPAGLLDAEVKASGVADPRAATLTVDVGTFDLRLTGFQLGGARPIARNGAVRRRHLGGLRRADAWLAGDGDLVLTVNLPAGRIEGDDTALDFGGAVTVRRSDDDFTVEGGIETRAGRFLLFDNPFELTGGALSIQGGTLDPRSAIAVALGAAQLADVDTAPAAETLDPVIDLRAAGQIVETDVRVRIVGPSRRPSLILESDPPLPEYQILTLLITGRVDAIDDRNGEVRRQAARLIDRFHNPSLARQLYDRLGVDKLGLKFGASVTNPILTVGKQINRRLYVETVYHHDAPPDANEKEARVEYRLSPRWTLDTVAGDAGEGSLGLFWQTTFGRPPPPEADREE